jgi:O-antigen/teichoic acid export membrane protein
VLLGEVSKSPARRAQVLPYAIPVTLLCGTALLAIYLAVCLLILHTTGVSLAVLLAVGLAETVLQPLFSLPAAEHLALERIARSQLLQTLPLIMRLAAAAAVFLLQPGNPLVAYGYGYFFASIIALTVAISTMPAPWPPVHAWRLPRTAELRETIGYAALNITAVGPAELDKTLAARLLPLSTAGLYAAGARVVGAATLPVIAMMLSALPRLFREGHKQPQRTAHLIRLIFTATLAYSTALAVALWLVAPLFVKIFGAKYEGIQHMVHWLCLAVPGMALRIAAGSVLMALGRSWMRFGYEVAGLVILVIVASMLAPMLGAIGMPIALICSEWSMAAIGITLTASGRLHPTRRESLR